MFYQDAKTIKIVRNRSDLKVLGIPIFVPSIFFKSRNDLTNAI